MNRLWLAVLPELRHFSATERAPALEAARNTVLDVVELIGMAVGLVVVTMLTRYAVPDSGLATRFGAALANFAIALPLIALFLGPFHLRRLRRGLRERLRHRGAA